MKPTSHTGRDGPYFGLHSFVQAGRPLSRTLTLRSIVRGHFTDTISDHLTWPVAQHVHHMTAHLSSSHSLKFSYSYCITSPKSARNEFYLVLLACAANMWIPLCHQDFSAGHGGDIIPTMVWHWATKQNISSLIWHWECWQHYTRAKVWHYLPPTGTTNTKNCRVMLRRKWSWIACLPIPKTFDFVSPSK